MKTFTFEEATVAYETMGEGPTLVLITGLGGQGRFWAGQRSWLAERFRVITFDHPGIGASAAPTQAPAVDGLAQLVVQLLDTEAVERASIVGHSMGGAIAQVLGLDHPARVERLVLSATWARSDTFFHRAFAFRRSLLTVDDPKLYAQAQILMGYPPDWVAQQGAALDVLEESLRETAAPAALVAQRIDALLAFNRSADLPSLTAPTLVLAMADDQIVPPHMVQDLASRIPGSRWVELARGGHFAPNVEPAAYRSAIEAFLCA